MELTQQIANLQDEVKVLKGEIKVILKEIRTAVLSRDNPFAADANLPTFRSVDRQGAASGDGPAGEPGAQQEAPEPPPEPLPFAAPEPPATPAAAPTALRLVEPAATAEPPEEREQPARLPAESWNLLTIASLAAWAEDALATLGQKRFQLVMELASFADLLSPEVRDVLRGIAQLGPAQEKEDRPMNINECLVVLRQLEAILQGEKVSRLPRRWRARHSSVH